MAEILTESFCERCGTRYTFETVQPKRRSLGAIGTLGRGLKNFVVMSDSSFDEALAAARSEDEQKASTAQLEAFHRTFNFCLSCRQYTCTACWNAVEGRCLTCAPLPEVAELEVTEPPAAQLVAPFAPAPVLEAPPIEAAAVEAVPTEPATPLVEEQVVAAVRELLEPPEAIEAAEAIEAIEAAEAIEAIEAAEAIEAIEAAEAIEPEAASLARATAEVAPIEAVGEAPVEAELEIEVEVEAAVQPEAEVEAEAPDEAEDTLRAVMAAARKARDARAAALSAPPESEVQPEPEQVTPTTQPAAPEAPRAPRPSPFPGFQPGRSLDDEIAAYEQRVAALAAAPLEPRPPVVVAATPPAPALVRPAGAGRIAPVMLPSGHVPAAPGAPGTCRACGLSISASARFCRRCGTAQQVA